MKWFYDLKIAKKLVLSFVVVLLMTTFVGLFSIVQLGKVNQASTDISTNWLPTIRTLADIKLSLARIRSNEAQIALYAEDAAAAADIDARNAKQLALLAAQIAKYETEITEPAERALFPDVKKALAVFIQEDTKIMAAARADKEDEVRTLYRGNASKTYYGLLDQVEALAKVNSDGSNASSEQANITFASSRAWIIALLIGALALGMMLAFALARIISNPLRQAVEVAGRVAAGDLTATILASSNDETGQLMHSLKAMNDSLLTIVGQVRAGTDTIATASSEIANGNLDLSSRTEEQASSLEETASAMEQMTSTVKQNSDNARQANQLAVTASQVAEKGGVVVGQVVDTMHAIDDSAHKIMDIISVIEGIAFQTNILALNAAVEAARAGEQGRGFAVVASEVRNLAQRSATAAKEIKVLIDDSVDKVSTGSRLVQAAGETMEEVVTSVKRVTDIVGEISMANQEQSVGIDEINRAVMQMDEVTQQNAALVEEAAAAAASLQDQAQTLTQVVAVFKLNQHELSGAAPLQAAQPRTRTTHTARVLPLPVKTHKPALRAVPRQPALAAASSGSDRNGEWETF